ncbi:Hypothetical predicted protein [Marmota monax]|uniref:Multifunctional methyltransferase subunit TRM112-like protein n=1 Tax=Marmota monax TaxID=9995 RepID=A0A5E4C8G1_MARMO|nr:hypothetical protein GHT09_008320 [Marmota monax]VTJ78006.1 Hypothetical predicted protein [Marmota monax]
MKLFTYDLRSSHVPGVGPRVPATEVGVGINPDDTHVEWVVLLEASYALHLVEVPKELIEGYVKEETFLRKMYHLLLEVDVLEGTLQCLESGRVFPISRGIPNMLLNE